jgi:mono/diheme cytochrome c family protein
MMRKIFIGMMSMAVCTATAMVACMDTNANKKDTVVRDEDTDATRAARVKQGEYLVSIIGCDDCHSPKKMGAHGPELIPELRLSGYPSTRPIQKADSNVIKQGWALFGQDLTSAVGPWGMSFAANITSDDTGIGNWTEENFIRALRKGKLKGLEGSRDLLPPMPWFVYKNMTDEDLKSIYAYLKTVPAVENVVPAPKQLADIK